MFNPISYTFSREDKLTSFWDNCKIRDQQCIAVIDKVKTSNQKKQRNREGTVEANIRAEVTLPFFADSSWINTGREWTTCAPASIAETLANMQKRRFSKRQSRHIWTIPYMGIQPCHAARVSLGLSRWFSKRQSCYIWAIPYMGI